MTDHTQKPAAHGCSSETDHDREVPEVDLLSPLTIRGVTLLATTIATRAAELRFATD